MTLVKAHMHQSTTTAAGPTAVLDGRGAFAATQAAWRFLNNERVTLGALAAPLREAGRRAADDGSPFVLVVHDWSKLDYGSHASKKDTVALTEASVVLDRPGRRREHGRQRGVPGRPLPLRLVVACVVDDSGRTLGTWYLLTNAPAAEASATTIARWYDWRWRIESYFKLLKSHGQQIEHWQQETASAIARRLLVAAMACVVVWDLRRRDDKPSTRLKDLLVRLSGRQTQRRDPHTAPALLAGLFVLLPILTLLDGSDSDLHTLKRLAEQALPFPHSG